MSAEDPAISPPYPTLPSVGLSDPPKTPEVLTYLDWEIYNIREQAKVVGASTWSLTLALGAVLWLLLSQDPLSWAQLPPVLYLICGFALVEDLLIAAYYNSREKVPPSNLVRRVTRLSLLFGSQRRKYLFLFLRCLLLLFALTLISAYATRPARWIAGAWFAAQLPFLFAGFLMGGLDIELPPLQKARKTLAVLVATLSWVFPLASAAIYWQPVLSQHLTLGAEDYKTALLVLGASFLFSLLIGSRARAEVEPELLSLRRDLALGRMKPDDAAEHAAYLVSGHTVEAYVRRKFRTHDDLLQSCSDSLKRIMANLIELEADLPAGSKYKLADVPAILAGVTPYLDGLDKLSTNATNVRKTLTMTSDLNLREELHQRAAALEERIRVDRRDALECIQRIRQVIEPPGRTAGPNEPSP